MNSKFISKATEKIKTNFMFTSTNVKTKKNNFYTLRNSFQAKFIKVNNNQKVLGNRNL